MGIFERWDQRTTRVWSYPSWWNLLVALPWTLGLIFCIHGWKTDDAIAQRQQTTQGVITAHDLANHNQYGYTFYVNGKSYTGWQSPRTNELQVGKQVLVYYDPVDPAKNALTDFDDLSVQRLGPVPLLMFGIGAVAVFIFVRRRKRVAESS